MTLDGRGGVTSLVDYNEWVGIRGDKMGRDAMRYRRSLGYDARGVEFARIKSAGATANPCKVV